MTTVTVDLPEDVVADLGAAPDRTDLITTAVLAQQGRQQRRAGTAFPEPVPGPPPSSPTDRHITIDLPDDVAAFLLAQPSPAGTLTHALRVHRRKSTLRAQFAARGLTITDAGVDRMRERYLTAKAAGARNARRATA